MDIPLLTTITSDLNQAVNNYGLINPAPFTFEDLQDTENIVTDLHSGKRVSGFLFDQYFPKQQGMFEHYTDFDSLQGILTTSSLRLSSVHARFSQQEFKHFYRVHGMDGYRRRPAGPLFMEEALTKDAFFLSMCTHPAPSVAVEHHLWTNFAYTNGIKIIFELENWQSPVRQIAYPMLANGVLPLLQAFLKAGTDHGRLLVLADIGKIGFFYLPVWEKEGETRMLITRATAEHYGLANGYWPSENEYLIVPFEGSPIGRIVVREIVAADAATKVLVEQLLRTLPLYQFLQVTVRV
jgi:hypothetical protein